ncbi:MAG: cardiolipin synthase [Planctomycetaceae bacterium]
MRTVWVSLILEGYLLTLLLVPIVLLQKRRQPVGTLAWIMAIVILPFFGSLLYLMFGINRVARRAALKQASRRQIDRLLPAMTQYQMLPGETFDLQNQRLVRLADRVTNSRPCVGNVVEIVPDTQHTMEFLEEAIGAARKSIHLEYYIWQPDKTGTRLRDLLIRKAGEGVQVRFLFDGVGSLLLGRRFLQPMRDAGIEVASALPGASLRERWSINLRNHRKITVVDGQVGFTGGMNIGDEYLGRVTRLGPWRDTHLRLRGPVVLQLQQVFAEDWFFATGHPLTGDEWYPPPEETGDQTAQVVAGGPDGETEALHALFFAAINEARERLTLATSYFIPTPALVAALESAAYRGVRVRVLVPAISDHRWMVIAGRGFYESLLESGVEIFEYHRGILHCKTLSIDGLWSFIGSPNFDSRSLLLNFEAGVVIYGSRAASQVEEQFADDLRHARRIELGTFLKRPLLHRVAEQLLKLFSPVL